MLPWIFVGTGALWLTPRGLVEVEAGLMLKGWEEGFKPAPGATVLGASIEGAGRFESGRLTGGFT